MHACSNDSNDSSIIASKNYSNISDISSRK